ncbi:hypothetical protein ETAA8_67270 [Anatilimnocola aggregata]|uniref:Uncharacterized protein n=1 Tax=Anatilimnocola aggregata TaxID=2528021 RepID=A0A517YMX0_9BACT|nr:hypothetical protein ETAA8_67270 [Anatilimnocola aggregata]
MTRAIRLLADCERMTCDEIDPCQLTDKLTPAKGRCYRPRCAWPYNRPARITGDMLDDLRYPFVLRGSNWS